MNSIVCLDLEGVLIPEIWIEFAEETGIEELRLTTKDEPDYDKLMKRRLQILKENNYGINEIQKVIERVEPYKGAKEFLDELRTITQVLILSDTYKEFGMPVIKALQSVGFETIAAGDSYNDLGMIKASKAGFLFRSPDRIKNENQDVQTVESYEELLEEIKRITL